VLAGTSGVLGDVPGLLRGASALLGDVPELFADVSGLDRPAMPFPVPDRYDPRMMIVRIPD
jgi:hypothetical protein